MRTYRRRDAGTWLGGFATALAGDQIFYLALTWAAAQVFTPVQVGLLLVCGSVPRALILLLGGVAVDKIGPKRVIVASDSARTLIMVFAALFLAVAEPGPLLLVALAVVFGIVDGFFLPAVGTVPAFIVAPEDMAQLQAIRSLVYRGAPVLGAAAGGWLVAAGSISAAFAFNAVLFGLSVVALATTRMIPPATTAVTDPATEISAPQPLPPTAAENEGETPQAPLTPRLRPRPARRHDS